MVAADERADVCVVSTTSMFSTQAFVVVEMTSNKIGKAIHQPMKMYT